MRTYVDPVKGKPKKESVWCPFDSRKDYEENQQI